jgi:Ribbon-helix-helix protein, copG family
MVRIQIYLTEDQRRALREAAERQRLSMSELIRRILDRHLLGSSRGVGYPTDAIVSFVGVGTSGYTDTSERHDEALAEFFRREEYS